MYPEGDDPFVDILGKGLISLGASIVVGFGLWMMLVPVPADEHSQVARLLGAVLGAVVTFAFLWLLTMLSVITKMRS